MKILGFPTFQTRSKRPGIAAAGAPPSPALPLDPLVLARRR